MFFFQYRNILPLNILRVFFVTNSPSACAFPVFMSLTFQNFCVKLDVLLEVETAIDRILFSIFCFFLHY